MGQIPEGIIVRGNADDQGRKSPRKAYGAVYVVANADYSPGADFEQFKSHCKVLGLDEQYAERVRKGQTDVGPFSEKLKGLLDAIRDDILEVIVAVQDEDEQNEQKEQDEE